jgi:hypothetical protein
MSIVVVAARWGPRAVTLLEQIVMLDDAAKALMARAADRYQLSNTSSLSFLVFTRRN